MTTHCWVLASLRILMRYWVILVILCLHLWTVKLGQYWSSWSICRMKGRGRKAKVSLGHPLIA